SGECCFRFDISDLLLVEDQQTANHSLRQRPIFGGQLTVPPEPDSFVADLDATFVKKVFDIPP
ncbi:hypothetical protein, partial [Oceanibium sediminis]|uniref:hypothetical protein n=1 Tax=Oceanibium sediminis TaxID=2026339 RepID=UPI001E6169C6